MVINKHKFLIIIVIYLILINLGFLLKVNWWQMRSILVLGWLLIIPGWLGMLVLKVRRIEFWEYLVYVVGLSLVFLYGLGLGLNWLLPQIGIKQPLQLIYLILSIDLVVLGLLSVIWFSKLRIRWRLSWPKLSLLDYGLGILAVTFPILSVLGTVILNNHGDNYLTIAMLGGVGVYVLLLVGFKDKVNNFHFTWGLWLIALALLLMTSFRGWYTTGHDNQLEAYVFKLTQTNLHWDIEDYRDPYNASISLTILPTILNVWLQINNEYIYKLVYQLIFAFTIIGVYGFLKRWAGKVAAFLSGIVFMSFPTFINDFPMLNRQEISTLFLILTLLLTFNKKINPKVRNLLFILFGFCMALSHYSTTYVTLALWVLTYIIFEIMRSKILGLKKKLRLKRNTPHFLSWQLIVIVMSFTFIWNALLTDTTAGLNRVIADTYQNIGKALSQDLKSGGVLYSIFSWKQLDTEELFNNYVQASVNEIENKPNRQDYYSQEIYAKYPFQVVEDEKIPLTSWGRQLAGLGIDAYKLNYFARQGIAKLLQVLIMIGVLVLFIRKVNRQQAIQPEFLAMCIAGMMLLILFIVLPLLSIEYGTLRLFQQILVVLALPIVVGLFTVFKLGKENIRWWFTALAIVFIFWSLSGFLPQITGGYYPQLHLNNQGIYYNAYYTHLGEIRGIKWLASHLKNNFVIQSNFATHAKLRSNAGLFSVKNLFPATIHKDAYVILDYATVTKRNDLVSIKNDLVTYNYPLTFLEDQKDLIYNNSGIKIYK